MAKDDYLSLIAAQLGSIFTEQRANFQSLPTFLKMPEKTAVARIAVETFLSMISM